MLRWLCLVIAVLAPTTAEAAITSETLVVHGVARTFELTTIWRAPRAIVVALHPRPATGRAMRHISGLDHLAEEAGVVVAYPDGLDRVWNAGECCGEADDTAFIEALVGHLRTNLGLEDVPAYVIGVSNGAAMAERLVLENPTLFAGAALISGAAPAEQIAAARLGPALPTLVMIGRSDPAGPALESSARARSERHGCRAVVAEDASHVQRAIEDCGGAPLATWRLDAAHVWPGAGEAGPLSWPDAPFEAGRAALAFFGLLPANVGVQSEPGSALRAPDAGHAPHAP